MHPPPGTPPSPPPPPQMQPRRKNDISVKRIATALAVVFAAMALLNSRNGSPGSGTSGSTSSGQHPKSSWRWEFGDCNEYGLTGLLTNESGGDLSGTLWATAYRGDKKVAGDREIVISLPPGQSESIDFAWSLDEPPTRCTLDRFEK